MSEIRIEDAAIPEVKFIQPRVFADVRGHFFEDYHREKFLEAGIQDVFVQDNQSFSLRGTLRGLHYQLAPMQQGKLCRVATGEVLDVAVDVRVGSPTFRRWVSCVLSAEKHNSIYIPAGFAHGFLVLSESAHFLYKCTNFYSPQHERGIAWDDPAFAIDWGIAEPTLSEKDRKGKKSSELLPEDFPVYGATR